MGADFDFAGNLAKFDKDAVFAQFKADDDTPEDDLLVSHNLKGNAATAAVLAPTASRVAHTTEQKLGIREMVVNHAPLSAAEDPFFMDSRMHTHDVTASGKVPAPAMIKYVSEHGITVPAITPAQYEELARLLATHGVDDAVLRENFSAATAAMAIAILGAVRTVWMCIRMVVFPFRCADLPFTFKHNIFALVATASGSL
eukprot:m.384204 g.384204  ORF g.384204 m.384204 type:complete len:200 (-) comp20987_c0_seq2:192-791(-)